MAGDLHAYLRAERERREAASLLASRLERRDIFARTVAGELDAQPLAQHLRALAQECGVPAELIRAAVALEVARAREREQQARRAVLGGEP
jgi:hypothetical protein